ncbi:MAG: tetratricopeptide repeat protein [Candidatus Aminicenantes bacterium]|nr:tetratricopeptide repeat protein [Candidatus Aminicenantes bacterium]
MKRRGIFLSWLALWALTQAVSAQDKNLALLGEYSSLSAHIERAKNAFQRDNLAKCEQEVLFCLEKLPEHQEAHFLMSQVLYKRGEFEKALEHILAAEEGYLKLTEAVSFLEQQKIKKKMDNMASLFDDVQEYTVADKAAKSRGSCQPDRYSKDLQDAKDTLAKEERWNEADPNQEASPIRANYHYWHGNCLFRLKQLPETEAEYRLAIKADPRHSEAYNNLINLLFLEKRLDEARAFLSQAEAHKASIHPSLKKAVLEIARK